jgi:hypothetical protein
MASHTAYRHMLRDAGSVLDRATAAGCGGRHGASLPYRRAETCRDASAGCCRGQQNFSAACAHPEGFRPGLVSTVVVLTITRHNQLQRLTIKPSEPILAMICFRIIGNLELSQL